MQFAYTSSLPLSMAESLLAAKKVGEALSLLSTSRVECLCSGKKKKENVENMPLNLKPFYFHIYTLT